MSSNSIEVPGVGTIVQSRRQHEGLQGNQSRLGAAKWVHADGSELSDRELRTVMRHLNT